MRQGLGWRRGRIVLGALAAAALLVTFVQPARATDAFPGTDDHSTTTATARWWYYGQTAKQVGDLLSQHDARLISIDPYQTGGGLRFAVVMVPNSGAQDRAWWWHYGQTTAQVGALLDHNHARLVALRPYLDGGQRLFAVIMVANAGADFKPSQWWAGASIDSIAGHVTGDKMRVTALAPDPAGGWDAILVASEGETCVIKTVRIHHPDPWHRRTRGVLNVN